MSIVSSVPGRIRLESGRLVCKAGLCRLVAEKLGLIKGIMHADINPRTGRILIEFDETQTAKEELIRTAKSIVREAENIEGLPAAADKGLNNKGIGNAVVHAAIDIAGHLLMPKPLGFLVPLAVNAMRKNL